MFSGIIEVLEKPKKIQKLTKGLRVEFDIPKVWKVIEGESVNIDGVCSTVEKLSGSSFTVYYMPETLSKTTLPKVLNDHFFNLEKSLTLSSLVGGHLVSGHVDTVAILSSVKDEKDSKILKFKLPGKFIKHLVYKGSITVNGVSLTVVSVDKDKFTVSLIPYTLSHTNLGELKVGDEVNIEVDLISKYLEKLVKRN